MIEVVLTVPDPFGTSLHIGPPTDTRWPENPAAYFRVIDTNGGRMFHIDADQCRVIAAVLLALAERA